MMQLRINVNKARQFIDGKLCVLPYIGAGLLKARNMRSTNTFLLILSFLVLLPGCGGPPAAYPLKTCVVSEEDLDDEAIVLVYEGRQIKFCCKECVQKFNANPGKFIKIIEDAEKKK